MFRINPKNVQLFVCDVQEIFRSKIVHMKSVIRSADTLVKVANHLEIPTIVTTQYAERFGDTVPEIQKPTNGKFFDKTMFSMLTKEVQEQINLKERGNVILCGIEGHVCVLQTCLDLLHDGHKVHVVVDGVSSQRSLDCSVALQRMEQAGAYLTTVESIVFMLMKDAKHAKFKTISKLMKEHNAIESEFHAKM